MKWLNKWEWWAVGIIFAVALIIGWEEKSSQTQANKCRAYYASYLASVSIDQRASEQEAIAANCEPTGYLYRLFSPANLPTMLLVLIGIGGVVAALRTLEIIRRQSEIMEKELLITNRAYLTIGEPEVALNGMARIPVLNLGKVPAHMTSVQVDIRIQKLPDMRLLYEAKAEKDASNELVVPGTPNCALFIKLPQHSLAEDVETIVAGLVTYRIGFGNETDKLRFCPIYSTKRKAWHHAFSGVGIDFNGDIARKGPREEE